MLVSNNIRFFQVVAPALRMLHAAAPTPLACPPGCPRRARRRRCAAVTACGASLEERVGALVSWCVERGAEGSGLAVSDVGPRGRGVVATRDIAPGEVLLSLPLSLGLADDWAPSQRGVPWHARLALRVLREQHLGVASEFAPYLALLPDAIASPLVDDTMRLRLRAYAPLLAECDTLRSEIADAHAALGEQLAGVSVSQFAAAVALVHSRAYGFNGNGQAYLRVLLPLCDMLNHGGDEGQDSEEAPCWPPVRDAGNCRWDVDEGMMYVSATKALSAGDEALFSYREQSSDHFLLYYGFCPPANPHDDVVLFADLPTLLRWHADLCPSLWAGDAVALRAAARAAVQAVEADVAAGGERALLASEPRIKALGGGRVDGRLLAALAAIRGGDAVAASRDLAARCREVLTPLEQADVGVTEAYDPVRDYLRHKARILRETLATLNV